MTWTATWEPRALDEAAGHLTQDPTDVRALLAATDRLADGPAIEGARPWGAQHYRLHRGPWRVLYRVDHAAATIHIEHIGRNG
ncbi:type II toxin-antitoxin system RelE/ParE family toxin [Streptomyces polyrhachis]|uniref:Type II toxin-antitoxin system RelE/ParE family toxin n=1 Tax=Streptomyces polyrhachis TaxID=1282885 RepID=A0ABW2GI85_9ACTN